MRVQLRDEEANKIFEHEQAKGNVGLRFMIDLADRWFCRDDISAGTVSKLAKLIRRLNRDDYGHLLFKANELVHSWCKGIMSEAENLVSERHESRITDNEVAEILDDLENFGGSALGEERESKLLEFRRILIAAVWAKAPPSRDTVKKWQSEIRITR